MAKKEITLTQTEILSLAIRAMTPDVEKYDRLIKAAEPRTADMFKEAYAEPLFKFKKLLELYKLQTGVDYWYEFDFDFLKEG